MSARSLNKVMLIGNLTREPNLRFTPNGSAVCSMGLATNRSWTPADGGEKQEKVEFHNLVAWSKLAEICGQLLHKGDKIYVEGRLQTRDWKGDDGLDRKTTEVVIDNMMLLRSSQGSSSYQADDKEAFVSQDEEADAPKPSRKTKKVVEEVIDIEDVADDVPF